MTVRSAVSRLLGLLVRIPQGAESLSVESVARWRSVLQDDHSPKVENYRVCGLPECDHEDSVIRRS